MGADRRGGGREGGGGEAVGRGTTAPGPSRRRGSGRGRLSPAGGAPTRRHHHHRRHRGGRAGVAGAGGAEGRSPLLGVQLPLQPPLANESHGAARPKRRRCRCHEQARPRRASGRRGERAGPRPQAGSRSGGPGRGRPPRLYCRRGGGKVAQAAGEGNVSAPSALRPRPGCSVSTALQGPGLGRGRLRGVSGGGGTLIAGMQPPIYTTPSLSLRLLPGYFYCCRHGGATRVPG